MLAIIGLAVFAWMVWPALSPEREDEALSGAALAIIDEKAVLAADWDGTCLNPQGNLDGVPLEEFDAAFERIDQHGFRIMAAADFGDRDAIACQLSNTTIWWDTPLEVPSTSYAFRCVLVRQGREAGFDVADEMAALRGRLTTEEWRRCADDAARIAHDADAWRRARGYYGPIRAYGGRVE